MIEKKHGGASVPPKLFTEEDEMFKELENTKIFISDTLYLRYDIYAMIRAEKEGLDFLGNLSEILFDPAKAIKYLEIGLECCLCPMKLDDEQKKTVVAKAVETFGAVELSVLMIKATKAALPEPIKGIKPNDRNDGDLSTLMHRFVDVMNRSEKEFFKSTLREVIDRWDDYAEFHGYKKPTETFNRYDD